MGAALLPSPTRRAPFLCALLCASLMLAVPAAEQAAAATGDSSLRPLRTGVSYLYREDAEPIAFQRVREAGGTLVLTPVEWERVVPGERPAIWNPEDPADPNYKWEPYDKWVVNAVAAGLTPTIQVRGAPPWAQRCGFIRKDTPCDPNPADLAAFTTAVVRRYSGQFGGLPRVRYWQALNEPNLSMFFEPQFVDGKPVSAYLYRTLINTFTAAVKAVDPTNLVVLGGLGPIAVPKFTIGPMQFTRELLCMRGHKRPRPMRGNCGGGVHFDIFDIHPYTTGAPSREGRVNDVQMGSLKKLQTLIAAADKAKRIKGKFKRTPLWVSELSWDSNPPDPGGLPPRILNRWTAEALHGAWRAGVRDFFWFSLRDFKPHPKLRSHESLESGLFYRGASVELDEPKPVFYAFRFPFVAYPREKGLYFWGRTPNSRPGKVTIQVSRGKGWRAVRTVRANKAGMFQGLAPTRYGRGKKGAARAHFGKGSSVPFSMRPVKDFRHPPFGAPVG